MKVLLFTHKNDIDGMGSAVLGQLVFEDFDYELCGTFELTEKVEKYYQNGKIYDYDRIFVTDLCLEDPILTKIANDKNISSKITVLDHHKTFFKEEFLKHNFINVVINDNKGLCCGTSLFYEYLRINGLIDDNNKVIKEFVELTRLHDTWEWKNIYNNDKARELAILFDVMGHNGYINLMVGKLSGHELNDFKFNDFEQMLIQNRILQIEEKMKVYEKEIYYKEILGMKAGIVVIDYEYRNELAEYFRENSFDMDFAMMISLDRGVVCYRSVKDDVNVEAVAKYFGGKGHTKAASNPISEKKKEQIIKILTK